MPHGTLLLHLEKLCQPLQVWRDFYVNFYLKNWRVIFVKMHKIRKKILKI